MAAMPESRQITIGEKDLQHFCEQIFIKHGVPKDDARVTTEVLVIADLRGIESHGVARLPRYVTGLREGYIQPVYNGRTIKETKATAVIDAGQSLGQVARRQGSELAIRKARETAVGVVTVRNSNHFGIGGYYAMMALEHDLIGMCMTNAAPLVVPTFGRTAVLGTNPISLVAPATKEKPFVLDMATSVVPRGKLEVLDRAGKKMPLGWAGDETGKGTTDPASVLAAKIGRASCREG